MEKIRVAIDPQLLPAFGHQMHWALRQLISGCGWAWEEVPPEVESDLALLISPEKTKARLAIRADVAAWGNLAKELREVQETDGLDILVYAEDSQTETNFLTCQNTACVCTKDLIYDYFWLVTGQQEKKFRRDNKGFVDLGGTVFEDGTILRQALASRIGNWLQQRLIQAGCPQPLPRWPNGKKAAVFSGHDVDYPEIIRFLEPVRVVLRQGFKGLSPAFQIANGKRHHWHFPSWVKLEKFYGFCSAFYFVPRQGSLIEYATGTPDPFYDISSLKFAALFKYLADEGYEIGLHASYLAYQGYEKLAAEKERLEKASNQSVIGNRHHYWHLNSQDPEETLSFHEKAGLLYDSSLVNDRYVGWRRHSSWPFFPYNQTTKTEIVTLQMSVVWMDDQLFGFKGYNPGENMALLTDLVENIVEQSGCLGIDIHDYVFDERLHPGWRNLYQQFLAYLHQRSDIWFALPRDVYQHWSNRYQSILKHSQGLHLGLV